MFLEPFHFYAPCRGHNGQCKTLNSHGDRVIFATFRWHYSAAVQKRALVFSSYGKPVAISAI